MKNSEKFFEKLNHDALMNKVIGTVTEIDDSWTTIVDSHDMYLEIEFAGKRFDDSPIMMIRSIVRGAQRIFWPHELSCWITLYNADEQEQYIRNHYDINDQFIITPWRDILEMM